jgi:hypothetical protein
LVGLLVALLGVALIGASLRLVPAALHRHAARTAVDRVPAAGRAADAEIAAMVRHSRRALALTGDPGDLRRLALAAHAREKSRKAVALLVETVRRAPGDAVAWTRLAALYHRMAMPGASVDALDQALRAAPSMRHLAPVRAELILRRWPDISTRAPLEVLERQIRFGSAATPDLIGRVADATQRRWLLKAARADGIRRP